MRKINHMLVLYILVCCLISVNIVEGGYGSHPGVSNIIQITSTATNDVFPDISNDGKEITYQSSNLVSGNLKDVDLNWDIWRMDRLGKGGRVMVTNNAAADFCPIWSPNDNSILYSSNRSNRWDIWVKNRGGNKGTYLFRKDLTYNERELDISPTGDEIVFSAGYRGNNITLCFRFPGPPVMASKVQDRSFKGNWPAIWISNIDGSNQRQLVDRGINPAWSPDGKFIAFASNISGTWDIWTIKVDGSQLRKITGPPDDEYYPSWSPDGEWIAFTRSKKGEFTTRTNRGSSDDKKCCLLFGCGGGSQREQIKRKKVNKPADIWMIHTDGSESYQLTSSRGFWDEAPSWGRIEIEDSVRNIIYFHTNRPQSITNKAFIPASPSTKSPCRETPLSLEGAPLNIWALVLKPDVLEEDEKSKHKMDKPEKDKKEKKKEPKKKEKNKKQKKSKTIDALGSVPIEVLNSTNINKFAKKTHDWMKLNGFNVTSFGNAEVKGLKYSKIFYEPGKKKQARMLAKYLTGEQYIYEDTSDKYSSTLTLILGKNNYQLLSPKID